MAKMVRLVDSTFHGANSFTLAGQNLGEHPESFQWDRNTLTGDVAVFTDLRLRDAITHPASKKIGLIVESPAMAKEAHKDAIELCEYFDIIFTHSRKLLSLGDPFKPYLLGGSWIRRWGVFPKTETVSLIVGAKTLTEGHKLRHIIARRFGDSIDLFGEPYTERLPSKVPMLRPYRYSIVIENAKSDYYFSEKLIDCISQGTIPIYWGCPSIGDYLNLDGIIPFNTMSDLQSILAYIGRKDYERRFSQVVTNLAIGLQFRCAEDWIVGQYPKVFE